jgi:two-component system chemotaxis response regulator CheB
MIRILIVDDSATARMGLRRAIERDPEMLVAGEAQSGGEALTLAHCLRPNVTTMDVMMRHESGIDVAAAIMAEAPCPIVIVTACDTSDSRLAYRALQAGALELVPKLPAPQAADYAERANALLRLLRNVAKIPVVHRRRRAAVPAAPGMDQVRRPRPGVAPRLVVIGASTGGPVRVRELLSALPRPLTVPIAVAQHIAPGFGRGFAAWLEEATTRPTFYVDRLTRLEPGHVYVAPDDGDLFIDARLYGSSQPPSSSRGTPSVDVLFQSAAAACGPAVISVLMTGMGADGAAGVRELSRAGATTFVQDPTTCAVSSMPDAALRVAAATAVLAPAAIPVAIERMLGNGANMRPFEFNP